MLLVIAFSAIDSIILASIFKDYLIKESQIMLPYSVSVIAAVIIAALAAEHTAFVLFRKTQVVGERHLFSTENLRSLTFKAYALLVLGSAWLFTPWQIRDDFQNLLGNAVYGIEYDPWFLCILGGLLVAFIAYPCTTIIRLSHKYKDRHASEALWWLGICYASTGGTLMIFQVLTRILSIEFIGVISLFNLLYYSIVVYYFRRTTILESFFATKAPSLYLREGEHLVVFYTDKVDKWKLFSTYIRQGLNEGDRVIFAHSDSDSKIVRPILREKGININKHERDGSVVLMSVSHAYMRNGIIDKGQLINFWNDLKADTRKRGFKHERDLFDLSDLSFLGNQKEEYFEYLREANMQLMDPFMIELRAVNIEDMTPQLVQEFKFLSTKAMDLLEHSDKFSRKIGVSREEVVGKILLLEFDPVSNYEGAIRDFVFEASANAEAVVIFTSRGSAIHSLLNKQENVKFLLLANLTQTSETDKHGEEIIIPANNPSLLLDALSKTVKSNLEGNFNLVFDNLTTLILQIGFERTFSLVRYAQEILGTLEATAIFLFNPSAHDQKIISSLRSLFSSQMSFEKDGLEITKLPETLMKT
jgi:hypothetical protein